MVFIFFYLQDYLLANCSNYQEAETPGWRLQAKNIINMALDIDHKFAMSSLLSISQRPLLRVIKPVVSTKNTNEHGVLYVHLDVGSCKALDGQSFFCHQQIITNTERQTQPDSNQTQPDEMKNVCLTLMGFCVI